MYCLGATLFQKLTSASLKFQQEIQQDSTQSRYMVSKTKNNNFDQSFLSDFLGETAEKLSEDMSQKLLDASRD